MPTQLFAAQRYTLGLEQPTEYQGVAVTPSDSTNLVNGPCTAIRVTGGGNVNVDLAGGSFGVGAQAAAVVAAADRRGRAGVGEGTDRHVPGLEGAEHELRDVGGTHLRCRPQIEKLAQRHDARGA